MEWNAFGIAFGCALGAVALIFVGKAVFAVASMLRFASSIWKKAKRLTAGMAVDQAEAILKAKAQSPAPFMRLWIFRRKWLSIMVMASVDGKGLIRQVAVHAL